MITANDLKGIMAMMPAFTTKNGDRPDAEDTVDTGELTRAVDQIIRDGGANVITTTGSFGEFHALLWEEHKKLIEATVATVKKRVRQRQQQEDCRVLERFVRKVSGAEIGEERITR
ncbi:MAG: dihydrodipicolinate synthase family protein [Candidatus Binatia bacterium]